MISPISKVRGLALLIDLGVARAPYMIQLPTVAASQILTCVTAYVPAAAAGVKTTLQTIRMKKSPW